MMGCARAAADEARLGKAGYRRALARTTASLPPADENGSHPPCHTPPVLADGSLVARALLAAGIPVLLVAGRLRVPGLLLFLFLGTAIGSHTLGLIDFSDYRLARRIGIIALALILFEGGLDLGLLEIRPASTPLLPRAIVGTVVTAVVTWFAAGVALLSFLSHAQRTAPRLGAVRPPTAWWIFALLRGSTLKRRLATTLEGASGFNHPVAILPPPPPACAHA